jgi:hypothetical protein
MRMGRGNVSLSTQSHLTMGSAAIKKRRAQAKLKIWTALAAGSSQADEQTIPSAVDAPWEDDGPIVAAETNDDNLVIPQSRHCES